ncbi:hypothetical protein [Paenibacillus sp. SI8]|uniref:hypothetical protein n=1 Tax=unclassified Paenibacillus TaxID=185978 RepID=UPI003467927E
MMHKFIQQTALTALLLAAVIPAAVHANEANMDWINNELAPFKQSIVPAKRLITNGQPPISKEEWDTFSKDVLNTLKLKEPISIPNWATLLKLSVRLPEEADQLQSLLQAYVYDFNTENQIRKEDAVGGMIKLLSMHTLNASWDANDPDPRQTITDVSQISDKQMGLFYIAFREGILDSSVKDQFHPKAPLTNQEAISMAHRIIQKYGPPVGYDALWPDHHWSSDEVKSALRSYPKRQTFQQIASTLVNDAPTISRLDQPMDSDGWRKVLLAAGAPRPFVPQTASQDSIERWVAIDELVKLYGPSREVTGEEIDQLHLHFTDTADTADADGIHSLALATSLGWVKGDAEGLLHPKRLLTRAEAYILAARVSDYLMKTEVPTK